MNELDKLRGLVDLFATLRAAQKRFFKKKDNLDECKRLEREVDRAIVEHYDRQGKMF